MGTRGMSIDSMRMSGGRCPSLLVIGLLIACIMMLCNWWTLSSTNLELLRQIDDLNVEIKRVVEDKSHCLRMRSDVDLELKNSRAETRTKQVKLSQIEDTLATCNQELKSCQRMDVSKSATLEVLRMDKSTLAARLNAKLEEVKKLDNELSQVKEELEKTKLSINAPPPRKVSPMPIANVSRNKAASIPQLGPVKMSAVEISVEGQKGLHYHGIPILPQDPPGAERLAPRVSVTNPKLRVLEKHNNTKDQVKENEINKTVNTNGNQAPNPQMNAPPNAENIEIQGQDLQDMQDKDNSNANDNNAAEVDGANLLGDSDLNLNFKPEPKVLNNENK